MEKLLKMRIKNGNKIQEAEYKAGKSILEVLQTNGIYVPALCAGNGTCGKCKVKILEGDVPITLADREKLSVGELETGMRLACKAYAGPGVFIEAPAVKEDKIIVEGVLGGRQNKSTGSEQKIDSSYTEADEKKNAFIAVDIGTTTIAMALAEAGTGRILDTYTALNRQRMYGADVISRIAAANAGKLAELKQLMEEDLWQGIVELSGGEWESQTGDKKGYQPGQNKAGIDKIIIAGNTTMVHLLMGYSCESLGRHPFTSEYMGKKEITLKECISKSNVSVWGNVPVTILPGISAFLGSDIVAGLLACPGFKKEGICLLLDLGTNGELVLGNKERMIAASAAAGPAFEGGNMVCGTGSIPGAVSQVKIQNRRAAIRTIGGIYPPIGICGTGIISVAAELKRNRIIDEQGTLQPPYDKNGFSLWTGTDGEKIAIYQQDIRQFQLAKAAIRAGMEQLMQAFGCLPGEIAAVYLAGGFGTQLSVEDAIETGILPAEFKGKVTIIGNGALQGAIQYGVIGKEKDGISICGSIEGLALAETEGFEKTYVKFLNF